MRVQVPFAEKFVRYDKPATVSQLEFGVTRARGRNPHFCLFMIPMV